METEDIKEVLNELGFKLRDRGPYWQTNALWRNGDNFTAVQIYKDSGVWRDYVDDTSFLPFQALVEKTLGTKDKKILSRYIQPSGDAKSPSTFEKEDQKVKIQMDEIYSLEYLSKLLPHFKFYNDKKVSNLTLKLYKGGLATAGKLNGRFVFPIFDENDPSQIIGFTGRHLRWKSESEFPKWKHVGRKSNWLYPICISNDTGSFPFLECTQERREIIIVESIGDSLALTENNFLNHLVVGGLDLSSKQISFLLSHELDQIIIATNNDKSNVGLHAAVKIFIKLLNYFDITKLRINLPTSNDFGDMQQEGVNFKEKWYEKPLDKEKQISKIYSILKSTEGMNIIKNKTERKKKINFLKDLIEQPNV